MGERKEVDAVGGKGPATPENKSGLKSELPRVESPPLSPAAEKPAVKSAEPSAARSAPAHERQRHTRLALIAAAVVVAAGFGAMIGGAVTAGWQSKPGPDKAAAQAMHERQTMQQALDRLSRQIASLRADLDKTSKATHSRIARLADRLDAVRAQPASRSPETTGSIPPQKSVSVPLPRPAPRIAAAASRPTIVPGWSIRDARGGFIYVESRGDIYQVVPGAYLPGLGPVQSIERKDGRWAVVTPRGLIVSMNDRRYFE
jgi:hypothetical protein